MTSLSVQDVTVGEGDGFAEIVVRLDSPSASTISVGYTSEDSTAFGSTDYVYPGGTLTFAPGETAKTVRVQLRNDSAAEGPESWTFILRDAVNATLARSHAAVRIVDNDTVAAAPTVFVGDLLVDEKQGTASFVVRLGHRLGESSSGVVSVGFATRDLGATSGQDYAARSGTLTFQPGESVKLVVVDLFDDGLAEAAERFELALANPVGAVLGDATAVAEIGLSDTLVSALPRLSVADVTAGEGDGYVDLAVTLHAPSTNTVTVGYTSEDTSAYGSTDYVYPGGTLNFAPGETTKTVRVQLRNDGTAEGVETWVFWLRDAVNATIARAQAAVSIVDDDTLVAAPTLFVGDALVDEKQGTASFVVRLGQSLGESGTGVVSVAYTTRDGSGVAGQDYAARSGRLTFHPGESAKTVVVDLVDDALAEPPERFALVLHDAVNAVLGDAVAVAEIGLSDGLGSALPRISVADVTAGEGDGYVELAVTLHAPSTNVISVGYTSEDSTAFGSRDYVYPGGTLTFAPGETTKSVRVRLRDDLAEEPMEVFDFRLRDAVNATIARATAQVTIVDDDNLAQPLASFGRSDDVYTLGSGPLRFVEAADGGFDVVRSASSYTIPATLEGVILTGTANNATGHDGANFFQGNARNNTLDGRGGIDTAAYAGRDADHAIGGSAASRTVSGPAAGTDTLLSIERLRFDNTIVAYDTAAGGHTWAALLLLNAALNAVPSAALLGQWTAQMDRLGSMQETARAMIQYYAPGIGNEDLVIHLWSTVAGTPIAPADLDRFAGLIASGAYTQASLFEAAALHALNADEVVGLVGQPLLLDPAWFPLPGG